MIPLLAVAAGVAGIFGFPQRYGFTDQQLLIDIISFVAPETIVLNPVYLEEVTEGVRHLISRDVAASVDSVLSPSSIVRGKSGKEETLPGY